MIGRRAPSVLHLHVGRIVVDADSLATVPRELFGAQVKAALGWRLSGTHAPAGEPALAARIGDAVAPRVRDRVTARGAQP